MLRPRGSCNGGPLRCDIGMNKMQQTQALPSTSASNNGHASPRSLEGLHSTVEVPHEKASFWRHYRAFVGPAFLISVGYMDPGNWRTTFTAATGAASAR